MKTVRAAAVALALAFPTAGAAHAETAVLAGGCFWCVEADLEKVPGVRDVTSGYAGGNTKNPTYQDYERGGHREVVRVDFDETRLSYRELLDIFLRTVDVTDAGGQFCDRGHAYGTAIYPDTPAQTSAAEAALEDAGQAVGSTVVTPIESYDTFWPAEDYHQGYYRSEVRTLTRFGYVTRAKAYEGYRRGCGRDATVRRVWGTQAYRGVPDKQSGT